MLHIEDRVGSIKAGKDADVVLWNTNPLSIYAKSEMTLVDGILFYEQREEAAKQDRMQQERTRLINAMLQAKQRGEATQKVGVTFNQLGHCDTVTDGSGVH
jgi:urease alpha subunit